jgi:hypothetical protein
MVSNFRLNTIVGFLTALLALFTLTCQPAQAQVKPFKITGAGIAPMGIPLPGGTAPHWSIGHATHMGRYFGCGAVATGAITGYDPETGVYSGIFGSAKPFVFVAANGDRLACQYGRDDLPTSQGGATSPGTFELVPVTDQIYIAYWIAEFVPVRSLCTGKFQGIKGSWIMYAISEPFVLGSTDPAGYSWQGEGFLEFAKGGKK